MSSTFPLWLTLRTSLARFPSAWMARLVTIFGLATVLFTLGVHLLFPTAPPETLRWHAYVLRTSALLLILGFSLLIAARGMRSFVKRAWDVALWCVGIEACMLSFTPFAQATNLLCALLLLGLLVLKPRATLASRPLSWLALVRLLIAGGAYYLVFVLGIWLFRRSAHAHQVAPLILQPLRYLTGYSSLSYTAVPCLLFARLMLLVGLGLFGIVLRRALRPVLPPRTNRSHPHQLAQSLIGRYATDSLAYFALQPDRCFFFASDGKAFLSYKVAHDVAVMGGGPVGEPASCALLVQEFQQLLERHQLTLCALGLGEADLAWFTPFGYRALKIGEEAVVALPCFTLERLSAKVRRAVRHNEALGIRFERHTPATLPASLAHQLHRVRAEWLQAKGRQEFGYSMTLGRQPDPQWDRDYCYGVAIQQERVVGYVGFVPVAADQSWSLDAMIRGADAPNGLMEYLLSQSAAAFHQEGGNRMSLNFATFAHTTNARLGIWHPLQLTVYRRLTKRFQMERLYRFNQKMQPQWQARYLLVEGWPSWGRSLLAVLVAERWLPSQWWWGGTR